MPLPDDSALSVPERGMSARGVTLIPKWGTGEKTNDALRFTASPESELLVVVPELDVPLLETLKYVMPARGQK